MESKGDKMIILEECESIKNCILSQNSDGIPKTIMITSSVRREGCSTVALNLAGALAKNKKSKVLLIDGNLRHSALHKFFELKNTVGLSDLILGKSRIDDVLKTTRFPNLSVITSGEHNTNLVEIFDSHNVKAFLAELKNMFDFLIFDSAPLNIYPDVHSLASQMDGVILVIHAGRTRWEAVRSAKGQLERVHSNILGVVLNRKKYVIPNFLYKRM